MYINSMQIIWPYDDLESAGIQTMEGQGEPGGNKAEQEEPRGSRRGIRYTHIN